MIVKLLTDYHLEFLSFQGSCTCSPESIHVKMPHCWKSHAAAHILTYFLIVSSADNFCKHSVLFDTLEVFLKDFFENVNFEEKKSADEKIN